MNLCSPDDLASAADWLKRGRIVAFATDTFYGLAVDPASAAAVQRLFDLKGRDAGAALPLVAASTPQVERLCGRLGPASARLAERFWPGPLSIVLDAPAQIVPGVHAGRGAIAIRVPAHAVARSLCEAFGGPLTATSANRSGEPPARTVADLGVLAGDPHVLVLDSGDAGGAPGGAPSTIVDVRGPRPILLREGAIAWNRVLESLQE